MKARKFKIQAKQEIWIWTLRAWSLKSWVLALIDREFIPEIRLQSPSWEWIQHVQHLWWPPIQLFLGWAMISLDKLNFLLFQVIDFFGQFENLGTALCNMFIKGSFIVCVLLKFSFEPIKFFLRHITCVPGYKHSLFFCWNLVLLVILRSVSRQTWSK